MLDASARRSRPAAPATMRATLRLLVMRYLVERALTILPTAIGFGS